MRSHVDAVSWSHLEMTDGSACLGSGSCFTYLSTKIIIGLCPSKSHELGKDHDHVFDQICWLQLSRYSGLTHLFEPYLTEYSFVQFSTGQNSESLLLSSEKFSGWYETTSAGIPTVWYRWSYLFYLLPLSQIITKFRFVLSQICLILTKSVETCINI